MCRFNLASHVVCPPPHAPREHARDEDEEDLAHQDAHGHAARGLDVVGNLFLKKDQATVLREKEEIGNVNEKTRAMEKRRSRQIRFRGLSFDSAHSHHVDVIHLGLEEESIAASLGGGLAAGVGDAVGRLLVGLGRPVGVVVNAAALEVALGREKS